MQILYSNVNGLYCKLSELKCYLNDKNIDIACITETHFNASLFDAKVDIPGYTLFRHDRDFQLDRTKFDKANNHNKYSGGGGSAIYIKSNLNAELVKKNSGPDSVAILLDTNIGKVLIGCLYRSPSLNNIQDKELLNF